MHFHSISSLHSKKCRVGFTLVELTIVIAIIAILAIAFTLSIRGITNQDNATTMEAASNKLRNAIYDYVQDNGSFPQSLNNLTSPYNYLRNITLNNGSLILNNIGSISYNNNTVSPCSRQSLNLQFDNPQVCQLTATDFTNNGITFGNNCTNNQITLCL